MKFEQQIPANTAEEETNTAEEDTNLETEESGFMGRMNKRSKSLLLRLSLLSATAFSALHTKVEAGNREDMENELNQYKAEAAEEYNKHIQGVEEEFGKFMEEKGLAPEISGDSDQDHDELDKEVDKLEKEKEERVQKLSAELDELLNELGKTNPEKAEKYKSLKGLASTQTLGMLEQSVKNLKTILSINNGSESNDLETSLGDDGDEKTTLEKSSAEEDDGQNKTTKTTTKFKSETTSPEGALERMQKMQAGTQVLLDIVNERGDNDEGKFIDKVEEIAGRGLDDVEKKMWGHTYKNLEDPKGDEGMKLRKLEMQLRTTLIK